MYNNANIMSEGERNAFEDDTYIFAKLHMFMHTFNYEQIAAAIYQRIHSSRYNKIIVFRWLASCLYHRLNLLFSILSKISGLYISFVFAGNTHRIALENHHTYIFSSASNLFRI